MYKKNDYECCKQDFSELMSDLQEEYIYDPLYYYYNNENSNLEIYHSEQELDHLNLLGIFERKQEDIINNEWVDEWTKEPIDLNDLPIGVYIYNEYYHPQNNSSHGFDLFLTLRGVSLNNV